MKWKNSLKGAIEKVNHCPGELLSNMFLVPKKTGDLRPVVNLKPLNEFVAISKWKVQDLVKAGDYLPTIDLKDTYFSIPIFPETGNIFVSYGIKHCNNLHVFLLATVLLLEYLPKS